LSTTTKKRKGKNGIAVTRYIITGLPDEYVYSEDLTEDKVGQIKQRIRDLQTKTSRKIKPPPKPDN